jgi:hypothetical protein
LDWQFQRLLKDSGYWLRIWIKNSCWEVWTLDFLINNNVKVDLFISPYHPKTYQIIIKNKKYKNVIESEIYYRKLATEKGLRIIGSFNPGKLDLDKRYFYDGMHLKEAGIEMLIDSIKG